MGQTGRIEMGPSGRIAMGRRGRIAMGRVAELHGAEWQYCNGAGAELKWGRVAELQ